MCRSKANLGEYQAMVFAVLCQRTQPLCTPPIRLIATCRQPAVDGLQLPRLRFAVG